MAVPEDEPGARTRAARVLAPLAFFTAATVLILLIHGSLTGSSSPATTSTPSASVSTPPATTPAKFYNVKAGDTLESIAAKYHTTVGRLLRLNPKIDPLSLGTGQRVRVR